MVRNCGRCFITSASLTPHCFLLGGLNWILTVRSTKAGSGNWALVVALTNGDAHVFFSYLRTNGSSWGWRNTFQ